MLASCDSAELTEAFAYEGLDPAAEWRADLRAALIAREIRLGNVKPGTVVEIDTFMPDFDGSRKPDIAKQWEAMRKKLALMGGSHA